MKSVMVQTVGAKDGEPHYGVIDVGWEEEKKRVVLRFGGKEAMLSMIQTARLIRILEEAYEDAE